MFLNLIDFRLYRGLNVFLLQYFCRYQNQKRSLIYVYLRRTSYMSRVITIHYVWALFSFQFLPDWEFSSPLCVRARDELKNESLKRKWRFIAKKLIFSWLSSQKISELDIWPFSLPAHRNCTMEMINSYIKTIHGAGNKIPTPIFAKTGEFCKCSTFHSFKVFED